VKLKISFKTKKEIKKRLKEFKSIWRKKSGKKIFEELIFCLLTPQTNALKAQKALNELKKKNLLIKGKKKSIALILKKNGIRFYKTKTERIIKARKLNFKLLKILKKLKKEKNEKIIREKLMKQINGFGLKEASHFLRNIGFTFNLAILDRHILKNLKEFKVIKRIPKITKKEYLKIEEKFKKFALKQKISLQELDLFFWQKETGIIFK